MVTLCNVVLSVVSQTVDVAPLKSLSREVIIFDFVSHSSTLPLSCEFLDSPGKRTSRPVISRLASESNSHPARSLPSLSLTLSTCLLRKSS